MSEEEEIQDIIEILELAKEEINNNDENVTAILDLQDLKALQRLYELYQQEKEKNKRYINGDVFTKNQAKNVIENYIPKDKIRELVENETIEIKTIRFIAVRDLEKLLNE